MPALKEVLRMPNASNYKYRKIFQKKQEKMFFTVFFETINLFNNPKNFCLNYAIFLQKKDINPVFKI